MLGGGGMRAFRQLQDQPGHREHPGGGEADDRPGLVPAVAVEAALALGRRLAAHLVNGHAVVIRAGGRVTVEGGDVVSVLDGGDDPHHQPDARQAGGAPLDHGARGRRLVRGRRRRDEGSDGRGFRRRSLVPGHLRHRGDVPR